MDSSSTISCPHMDLRGHGVKYWKRSGLCSVVTEAVKGGRQGPGVVQAHTRDGGHRRRGGCVLPRRSRAIVSSEHIPSIPFDRSRDARIEINVRRTRLERRLGGPAILPLALAKNGAADESIPDRSFSGIGGILISIRLRSYFLLGCGTVQVCTAAISIRRSGRTSSSDCSRGSTVHRGTRQ